MNNDFGKGIATIGIWGAVAIASIVHPLAGIIVAICAMFAMFQIWG